mmetsp:Transcript_75043/g.199274  ORF Transcript_75043/g.199274 Transcript_75043/m.199274 type:complete len:418 (-) Transcript_75043:797-2050(-)
MHVQDHAELGEDGADGLRANVHVQVAQVNLFDVAASQTLLVQHDVGGFVAKHMRTIEQRLLAHGAGHRHVGEPPRPAALLLLDHGRGDHLAEGAEVPPQLLISHPLGQRCYEVLGAVIFAVAGRRTLALHGTHLASCNHVVAAFDGCHAVAASASPHEVAAFAAHVAAAFAAHVAAAIAAHVAAALAARPPASAACGRAPRALPSAASLAPAGPRATSAAAAAAAASASAPSAAAPAAPGARALPAGCVPSTASWRAIPALRCRLNVDVGAANVHGPGSDRRVEGLLSVEGHKGKILPLTRVGVLRRVDVQDGAKGQECLTDVLHTDLRPEPAEVDLLDIVAREAVLGEHNRHRSACELVRGADDHLTRGGVLHGHVAEAPRPLRALVLDNGSVEDDSIPAEVLAQLVLRHTIRQAW